MYFFEVIDPDAFPDLDITAVTVSEPETDAEKFSAMTVETGDKYHIHVTAENVGDRKAQNFKTKYYLSEDTIFDKDEDIYIAFDQVETVGIGDIYSDRKIKDDDGNLLKARSSRNLLHFYNTVRHGSCINEFQPYRANKMAIFSSNVFNKKFCKAFSQ